MCELCKLQILNSFCTRWGEVPIATLEYIPVVIIESSVTVNLDVAGNEGEADEVPKVSKQLEKQVIEDKEEDGEEG